MDRSHRRLPMSKLWRLAFERSRAPCPGAETDDHSIHGAFGKRSGPSNRKTPISRDASDHRIRANSGDSAAVAFHGESRPRLFVVREVGKDFEWWRIPADSPSGATWLEFA